MKKVLTALCLLNLFSCNLFPQQLKKGEPPPAVNFYNFTSKQITEIDPGELNGKVLLIDFWATWCAPCIESIPHLNRLTEKYKSREVMFISLTYEPQELVSEFLKKHPMKSVTGIDTSFYMFRSFNGWAVPNIVMVNSKGVFAGRIHPSRLDEDVIETLLKGGIPDIKNTPEDLYKPEEAEIYFRSLLKKQK